MRVGVSLTCRCKYHVVGQQVHRRDTDWRGLDPQLQADVIWHVLIEPCHACAYLTRLSICGRLDQFTRFVAGDLLPERL